MNVCSSVFNIDAAVVAVIIFFFTPKVRCYLRIPFAVVFIGSTLFALQQLSGINAVFYFSSAVFKRVGVPSTLANAFIGISNLTGIVMLLDRSVTNCVRSVQSIS